MTAKLDEFHLALRRSSRQCQTEPPVHVAVVTDHKNEVAHSLNSGDPADFNKN